MRGSCCQNVAYGESRCQHGAASGGSFVKMGLLALSASSVKMGLLVSKWGFWPSADTLGLVVSKFIVLDAFIEGKGLQALVQIL